MQRPRFNNKKNSSPRRYRIAGDVRQYQLINTFGIGSIVDFAKDTVIIGGVDNWDTNANENENWENRKIFNENLQSLTGAKFFFKSKNGERIRIQ